MKVQDVLECSFERWYPKFKDSTVRSEIVKLSPEFVNYLLSDGIILPKSCDGDLKLTAEEENAITRPSFPEIESKIANTLRSYKNIFPKLNWSSCNDAEFMHGTRTKCDRLSEILVLLKSSDKIMFDLTEPFKHCEDQESLSSDPDKSLILREWVNINPSMEFRVFVACDQVIGISQRDVRTFYDFLAADKQNIEEAIYEFFEQKIQNNFPLLDFVMDVFLDEKHNVTLLDINPFGEMTDSLLFDWDDLTRIRNSLDPGVENDVPSDFRMIENNMGVQNQRFFMNSFPIDVMNGNMDSIKVAQSAFREQLSSDDEEDDEGR